ncbi:C-C motif chemokine 21c [Austrofundulus limnaeus]|uniref:C-C motif chemokine 21c n=1 Tax=Austrofundulus limnaeus TaxID=52670 RepID=A0A2I4B585_AUSLI|nr:PREDICTED: C-C motif chemokine 21c-like [Austrofundulus limnaeus]
MRLHTLFFLSVLSCLCFALGQGSYDDCCLKYLRNVEKHFYKNAVGYRVQKPDGGCNIPAIIFIMKKGRKYCANPNEEWVQGLMRKVDGRRALKPRSSFRFKKLRKQPHKG